MLNGKGKFKNNKISISSNFLGGYPDGQEAMIDYANGDVYSGGVR